MDLAIYMFRAFIESRSSDVIIRESKSEPSLLVRFYSFLFKLRKKESWKNAKAFVRAVRWILKYRKSYLMFNDFLSGRLRFLFPDSDDEIIKFAACKLMEEEGKEILEHPKAREFLKGKLKSYLEGSSFWIENPELLEAKFCNELFMLPGIFQVAVKDLKTGSWRYEGVLNLSAGVVGTDEEKKEFYDSIKLKLNEKPGQWYTFFYSPHCRKNMVISLKGSN